MSLMDGMDEEGQREKVACCVMRETLKTKAISFVLDPGFNWKPVECSEQ